jgi:hypothetical protein
VPRFLAASAAPISGLGLKSAIALTAVPAAQASAISTLHDGPARRGRVPHRSAPALAGVCAGQAKHVARRSRAACAGIASSRIGRVDIVGGMPEVIDSDTVVFAPALAAHRQSARQVADELLAAADDPGRLAGVTPALVRLRAADLLSATGDPGQSDEAVAILRHAIDLATPDEIGSAQIALGKTLAEQGRLAELETLARALLNRDMLTTETTFAGLATVVSMYGYGQQALGWFDDALTMLATRGPDRAARSLLEDMRRRVMEIRRRATADGIDPDDPIAMRDRIRSRPAAATVSNHSQWPTPVDRRLPWWPEPEYARLVRQLPDFSTLLGSPWRTHTALVEAAMSRNGGGRGQPGMLVAAEFGKFAWFLEWTGADPLAPSTMTAFAAMTSNLPAPVAWPPKGRAQCWCGSGRRYRDCCAG